MTYIYFMGARSVADSILQASSRAFTGGIEALYHYVVVFPDIVDFLHGRSFPNPAGLFPFEHYHLTVEIMNIINSSHIRSGIVGSMPAFFWGELYANFGYTGILLFPFFVGLFVCWFGDLVSRISPTPYALGCTVWLVLYISNLSVTSLSGYFFDIFLMFVLSSLIISTFILDKGYFRYRKYALSQRIRQKPFLRN